MINVSPRMYALATHATEALLTCKVADRLGSATADMKMLMQSIKKPSRKIDATL